MAEGGWTNWLFGNNSSNNNNNSDGSGFWSSLLPALVVGGLNAASAYQTGKDKAKNDKAGLKLSQDRLAFEKEIALRQLSEGSAAAALQAQIAQAQLEAQRAQMIQNAQQQAAANALRAAEGSAVNLNTVGQAMLRPFIR